MMRLLAVIILALTLASLLLAPPPRTSQVVTGSSSFAYSPLVVQPDIKAPDATPVPAGQDGWFQFRRDALRSAATSGSLSGPLQVRWKRGFTAWPGVFAELTVAGDMVYVANTDGKITALRAEDGTLAWEYETGAALLSTPAIGGGRLHAVNVAGKIVALDAGNGRLIWQHLLPSGVYASPALSDSRLYIGTMGGIMYAFSIDTGTLIWSYNVGSAIDAAPAVALGKVMFAAEDLFAYALNVEDGTLAWKQPLTGVRSWNAHPVASDLTGRVFFSAMNEFYEPTSTHREVISMNIFEQASGPLNAIASQADTFIGQNRTKLQPASLLNIGDGSRVTNFTVAPTNQVITDLPFSSWYWGSIRPVLWRGNKLILQSMWRTIIIDLSLKQVYQPNSNQNQTGHFVRGDEQVPISIAGDKAYGGIGENVLSLDLTNGQRSTLLGTFGSEQADRTPLTPPLSTEAQHVFPGNGYTDSIGTLIVIGNRAYYQQYGWVYCLEQAQ
jgi:PQQ-like domain/PQQ enzyme repeat